jgi:hypothetical protein
VNSINPTRVRIHIQIPTLATDSNPSRRMLNFISSSPEPHLKIYSTPTETNPTPTNRQDTLIQSNTHTKYSHAHAWRAMTNSGICGYGIGTNYCPRSYVVSISSILHRMKMAGDLIDLCYWDGPFNSGEGRRPMNE